MASTLFAPAVPSVLKGFHSTNSALASLMVCVFIIGFVIGPLVLSPMSEIYGRLPVTHISNVTFLIASIVCAVAVNIPMLVVFRLVMGLAGCVPMTLGGGFVADLMPQEKRGLALTIWTIGPLLVRMVCLRDQKASNSKFRDIGSRYWYVSSPSNFFVTYSTITNE
jgi:MFS family permease